MQISLGFFCLFILCHVTSRTQGEVKLFHIIVFLLLFKAGNAGMDSLAPPPASTKRDQKSPNAAKRTKLSTSSPTHVTSPPLDREQSIDKRSKESALDYALYGKRTWAQALDPNLHTNGTISQEVAENLATLDSKLNASQFQTLNEKMTDLYNQKINAKKSSNAERRNFLDDQVFSAVSQKSSGSSIAGIHLAADGFLRVKTEQELVGSAPASDASKIGPGNGKHAMDKDVDDRKGEILLLLIGACYFMCLNDRINNVYRNVAHKSDSKSEKNERAFPEKNLFMKNLEFEFATLSILIIAFRSLASLVKINVYLQDWNCHPPGCLLKIWL